MDDATRKALENAVHKAKKHPRSAFVYPDDRATYCDEAEQLLRCDGAEADAKAVLAGFNSHRSEARKAFRRATNFADGDLHKPKPRQSALGGIDRESERQREICKDLVAEARDRFAPKTQAKRCSAIENGERNGQIAERAGVSPAAISISSKKAALWATAGALVIACKRNDDESADAILSRQFNDRKPFCHDVLTRFETIIADAKRYRLSESVMQAGLQRIWGRAIRRIVEFGEECREPAVMAAVPPSVFVMLLAGRYASRSGGDTGFRALSREAWESAKRAGSLQHCVLRRQLAEACSYCGEPTHQIAFLRDKEMLDVEVASIISYRGDEASKMLGEYAARPREAIKANPGRSLRLLAEQGSALLGNRCFVFNEGQSMMVLSWADRLGDLFELSSVNHDEEARKCLVTFIERLDEYQHKFEATTELTRRNVLAKDRLNAICNRR